MRKLTGSNNVGDPSKKERLAKATKVTEVTSKTKGSESLKSSDGNLTRN